MAEIKARAFLPKKRSRLETLIATVKLPFLFLIASYEKHLCSFHRKVKTRQITFTFAHDYTNQTFKLRQDVI